jgi:hypothetical protein
MEIRAKIGGIPRIELPQEDIGDELVVSLDDRATLVKLSSGDVIVLGTLKGLVSERKIVLKSFESYDPDVVGLHIGSEEITGLKAVVKGKVKDTYLSSYEKIYARELSKYGEVQIPPPSLVEAFELSKKFQIPLKGLDFNDNDYSRIYTDVIDGLSMVRQSLRLKNINRRKFKAETAEDFILEWDRAVNKFKAFRNLEMRREKKMAKRIRFLSEKYGKVLAIVEYERKEGIIHFLAGEK